VLSSTKDITKLRVWLKLRHITKEQNLEVLLPHIA